MPPVTSLLPRRNPAWPVLKPLGPVGDSPAIRVNRPSCLVGDRSRVHLSLRSPLVSRSHALVIVDANEVYIRDLASRNRLFVNGYAVRETALQAADLLQIGPFRFRCYTGFAQPRRDAVSSARRAVLAVSGSRRTHLLDGRTFLIGRRQECELPLTFPAVSEVHAVIFRRGGRHFIRDLNSRTGTFVNGRRVREATLSDGDEVRVAITIARYQVRPPRVASERAQGISDDVGGESWSDSGDWSSASAMLSASASVSAQTMTSFNTDLELASVTELFPPEVNLPAAREFTR